MVPNTKLINRLRQAGYSYKTRSDRVEIWKQAGSTRRVQIRRHRSHSREYAATTLRLAGLTPEQIEEFLGECDGLN